MNRSSINHEEQDCFIEYSKINISCCRINTSVHLVFDTARVFGFITTAYEHSCAVIKGDKDL